MDPDQINLESIDKMFEYEKYARVIDDLSVDELKLFAKAYFELYLRQQEVVSSFAKGLV